MSLQKIMFKSLRKKNLNYKKYFLIILLISVFVILAIYDYNHIKDIMADPKKQFEDIKNNILKLFFSLLGQIIFLFVLFSIYFNFKNHLKIKKLQNRLSLWSKLSYFVNQIGEEVFNELPIGIIVIDSFSNEIQWINPYADKIFKKPTINTPLQNLHPEMKELLNSNQTQTILTIGEEIFDCLYNKEFNLFYLFNVTEREQIKSLYHKKTPVLVFLSFDNIEDSLKNWDFSEQSQIKAEYLSVLSDFVELYEGYLKQLSDDKFLLLLNRQQLENIMSDKFSILKTIRDISNKYKLKITLSMGVACYNLPYNRLASYAQSAIELAQKRGGDQVVVNIENQKIQYFGATQSSLSTNSKVSARVNSEIIRDLLEQNNNCFFMSHINPDLDSLGSMIAFYKIALSINNNYEHYIILDEGKMDQNFKIIYQNLLKEEPELSKHIITTAKAKNIINKNSLLVILDTQSKEIVNSPELLDLTPNTIIIDHHISSDEIIVNTFAYIDSSSSSAVEMLIELIYFLNQKIDITPFEASIMYGGMAIDTNYFTYRTNSRTLDAASQLISMGAESDKVKFWFRQEFSKMLKMNQLISNMEIYMDRFAIVKSNEIIENRSFLAKVAENVLNIQNIEAAFVVGRLQEKEIGISARSYNNVNVQIIMEQMGGGGHMNSAATQIEESNIDIIVGTLKNILALEYKEGAKNMKVILLEDIKNKGNKNDIIEITLGYGNFLIKEKKALLANDKNIKKIEKDKQLKEQQDLEHTALMNKLKKDIDNKQINLKITVGPKGKIYRKITMKQIVDEFFKEFNILINKKKIVLDSEINSLGVYKASVVLKKDITASFIINVTENKNE